MPTDVKRVQAVFLAAAEIADPADRAKFLDEACDGDTELRSRVEALLRAHDHPDSVLDHPAAVVPDPNGGATQALSGAPDHGVAAAQTTDGDYAASNGEPLTFLAPPTRPDTLGRLGHYDVLQVLGRGGFGIVFRAFDETLQRVVALKVMAPRLAVTSPARKRFLREARFSAQVRHENVVQVYEVVEQPLPYLAMEFIPGETLQQKLDRVGPLDVPEVLRIGRQVAEGLAAAHVMDLIHRDIKPGNVLLEGGHQKVKITDFGLARTVDDASISESGTIAGTPMYMAPEQALGQTLDQRADLFSFGSVLYQMVAGRPPFRASTTVAVLKRVAEDQPRAIREIIPETPQWLCDIIAKLHAKDPADRYQSAREVADVLADCEAQLKANARLMDYSRIPHIKPRRSGRRKWIAAAVAVLLAVIALAVTEFAGVTHLFHLGLPKKDAAQPGPAANTAFDAKEAQEAVAKQLGIPVETTNSIGMKLRFIPPGKFTMGSSSEEIDFWLKQYSSEWLRVHLPTEGPNHQVEITSPLYMGQTELTVGQFRQFVKATGYQTQAEREGGAIRHFPNGQSKLDANTNWLNPGFAQTDDHPVVCVSWNDAVAFCNWLSKTERKEYRLPTEAEWEYSCRAGSISRWCFGDDEAELWDYARIGSNSQQHTWPVAGLKGNAWGLHDMHGNAWELCEDRYDPRYYKNSPEKDPRGAGAGGDRALRGGSWIDAQVYSRSAMRGVYDSSGTPASNVGFRVVLAVSPPATIAPFTDADAKRIAALPAFRQVEEVRKELIRRNPGFDGKLEHRIEGGEVTEFRIVTDKVTDIVPIRVFNALRLLQCWGTITDKPNGQLEDLTPLEGMNLASLTHLDLAGTRVTDAGLVHFKDCKALRFLSLDSTRVTDRGLANFQHCEDLREVLLRTTSVTDAGMVYLKDRKGLTLLYLDATGVTDAGLVLFNDCKGLRNIGLDGTRVTDRGLANFKDCKDLQLLGVNGTRVTDDGMVFLKDCKNLAVLNLGGTRVTDAGLANLKDCKALKTLVLAATKVTDAGLANLKDCKNLTMLWVDHTLVGDAGMVHLQDCTNLTDLNLGGTKVSDVGLAHFKGCKKLNRLYLDFTDVGDASLAQFKGMPLRVLAIDHTGITDLTLLQGMALQEIRLTPKNITRGLDTLRDMKSLKMIGVRHGQVWPAAEFWERYDKGEIKE
jgi:serine/threonine protein kinase